MKDSVKSIRLSSPKGKNIFAETSVKLSAKVKTTGKTAGKALDWSSSNEAYATVSPAGVVTAKKKGIGKTVTITAKAADQSGVSATYKIKIVKDTIRKLELLTPKVQKIGYNGTATINVKITRKSGTTTGYYAARQLKWSDNDVIGTTPTVMTDALGTVKVLIATKKDAGKTFKVTGRLGKKKVTTTFKITNKKR